MKKCLIGLLVATVLLSGCQNAVTGGDSKGKETVNKETTFLCPGKGYNTYLFKFNHSDHIIPAKETGYLISTDTARSISSSSRNNLPELIKNTSNVDYYSVEKMQQKQYEMLKKYNPNANKTRQISRGAVDSTFLDTKKFTLTKIMNPTKHDDLVELSLADENYTINNKNKLYKMCEGNNCIVYYSDAINSDYADTNSIGSELNKNMDGSEKTYFKMIADKFDEIFSKMNSLLSATPLNYDLSKQSTTPWTNTPDKISLVVYDIDGDATDNPGLMTYGMFYPGDFYSQEQLDYLKEIGDFCYGNSTKCLYLDSEALLNQTEMLISTIVHEYSHMITFIQKIIKPNDWRKEFPTWYTEMIAMLSEDLFSEYLEIDDKNSPNSRLPYITDGHNLGFEVWNHDKVLCSYANAYAYGSFLVRNYGGLELYKQLILDDYRYVGKKGVERAIEQCCSDNWKSTKFTGTIEAYYKAAFAPGFFPQSQDNEKRYTLNRKVGFEDNTNNDLEKFGFKAIDLNNISWTIYYTDGTNETINHCLLWFYIIDYQQDIYPSSCSIHKVGEDLTSFKYMDNSRYTTLQIESLKRYE